MVGINLAENTRVYILKKEKNPTKGMPTVADYIDMTGYLIDLKCKKKINELGSVEVTFGGINNSTLRNLVKATNYLFVMTGYVNPAIHNKLIGKYLLEQPVYNNQGLCTVKGIQSTGRNDGNKQLTHTSNIFKVKHQNETLSNVLFSSFGICQDNEGWDVIDNGVEINFGEKKISFNVDYNNRMELVNKACDLAEAEWDINHGEMESVNPFKHGDTLIIDSKIGIQSTNRHTFNLSGSDVNCRSSSGAKTVNRLTNDVIVKGTDLGGEPIVSEMFNAGLYESYIDVKSFDDSYNSFDGWLIEDLGASSNTYLNAVLDNKDSQSYTLDGSSNTVEVLDIFTTPTTTVNLLVNGQITGLIEVGTVAVFKDGCKLTVTAIDVSEEPYNVSFKLYGTPVIKINPDSFIAQYDGGEVFLKIDNEVIKGEVDTSQSGYIRLINPTRGVNTSTDCGTGSFEFDTKQSNHKQGSDVVVIRDIWATGNQLTVDIPLNNDTHFGAGKVIIGSEKVVSLGNGTPSNSITVMRVDDSSSTHSAESWNNMYSHSHGIRVLEATGSGNEYITPDNPLSGSDIDNDGLFSQTFSEDVALNKDSLDKKCQLLLQNRSIVDEVVKLIPTNPEKFFADVNLGDAVSIDGADVVNLNNSGSLPTYRFVEFEYKWPRLECLVYLNKIERSNEFNTGDTLTESFTLKTPQIANDNSRANDFNSFQESSIAGGKKTFNIFNKEIDGVVLDKDYFELSSEDNDKAVNVRTLKQAIGTNGTGGGSRWELVEDGIRPIISNSSIFPNGTGDIGNSTNGFSEGYIGSLHTQYIADTVSGVAKINIFDAYVAFSDLLEGVVMPTNESDDANAFNGSIYYNSTLKKFRGKSNDTWADLGGNSLWIIDGSDLKPATSGHGIIPNGTVSLGSATSRWNNAYLNRIYGSTDNQSINMDSTITIHGNTGILIESSTGDVIIDSNENIEMHSDNIMTFQDSTGGPYTLAQLNADYSQWKLSTNGITPTVANNDIEPNTSGDIGASGNPWGTVYANSINADEWIGDLLPSSSTKDLGQDSSTTWQNLYLSNSAWIGGWQIKENSTELRFEYGSSAYTRITNTGLVCGILTMAPGGTSAGKISSYLSTGLQLKSLVNDLNIEGKTGLRLATSDTGGGVFTSTNVSTLRPSDSNTSLGNDDYGWSYLQIKNGSKYGKLTVNNSTTRPASPSQGDIHFVY